MSSQSPGIIAEFGAIAEDVDLTHEHLFSGDAFYYSLISLHEYFFTGHDSNRK